MPSISSSLSASSFPSVFLNNISLSNPFSIPAAAASVVSSLQPPSPTSSTTSSSADSSSSSSINNFNKKILQLEKELETIKIKKICFGAVSIKELDLFLEKVAILKNEVNNSVFY
uniref:Uncharacterized protein n=1 Tax=Panagrolaimus sp. PS1159 TaxID=55785 RepID=A0AC35F584_9BILA